MTPIKYDNIFDVVAKSPEEASRLQTRGNLFISLREIIDVKRRASKQMSDSNLDGNTFNRQDVLDALNGLVSPENLTAEEQAVYVEDFMELMIVESCEQKAFFKNQIKQGLGVGLDENDNIVRQSPKNEGNAV
jgi:predicted XRE-type DNA-binding protein